MTWFYRALACGDSIKDDSAQAGQRRIDVGDRFIALWICFNSIIRELYGEGLRDDKLISKSEEDPLWNDIFERNKRTLDSYLHQLMQYEITNMKSGKTKKVRAKNFSELIQVIYQIRSNLFHGRKNPYNDFEDSKDYVLIRLSFLILAQVVMSYLQEKNLVSLSYSEDYRSVEAPDIPPPTLEVTDFEDGLIFDL